MKEPLSPGEGLESAICLRDPLGERNYLHISHIIVPDIPATIDTLAFAVL